MSASGSDAYLRDAVMTATPEQLQLMLYDGAIRFAVQGRDAIEAKDYEKIYDRLTRAQKIVLELQAGLRPEVNPSLCAQMSALYNFIYRRLVDANMHRDLQALDEALGILRHQRETWVLLIEKLRQERGGDAAPSEARPSMPPRQVPQAATAEPVATSLSIEV